MSKKGFSLVELIVVMAILGIAMAVVMSVFIPTLKHYKQQSKIAETEIEKIVGLELLRTDLENAGAGLPWFVEDLNGDGDFTNDWVLLNNYLEAAGDPADDYNDASTAPPRAIVCGNDVGSPVSGTGLNNSDYLVIKSMFVRMSEETQKWTYITYDSTTGQVVVNTWPDNNENPQNTSLVVAIEPTRTADRQRVLATVLDNNRDPTQVFFERFGNLSTTPTPFEPFPGQSYLIFVIDPADNTNSLRMPFNRADYYISNTNVPTRCAPNTGVLMKAIISHADGSRTGWTPLLDCVADFQIILGLDNNENGIVGTYANADGSTVTGGLSENEGASAVDIQQVLGNAQLLRERLKEIRIYILAHEGQRDRDYDFGSTTIEVGEFGLGHDGANAFNLKNRIGNEYKRYRWKVYKMLIKPDNLS
jgi:prepilin-type N-terminal cleavage/methylation domain-containing protein